MTFTIILGVVAVLSGIYLLYQYRVMGRCEECPCHEGTRFCDGCNELLCPGCWEEHNLDAPCHVDQPEEYRAWKAGKEKTA